DNRLKADAENKLRQLFKKRENNTDAVNITSEEESGHFSGNVIRRKNQLIRDGRNKKSALRLLPGLGCARFAVARPADSTNSHQPHLIAVYRGSRSLGKGGYAVVKLSMVLTGEQAGKLKAAKITR